MVSVLAGLPLLLRNYLADPPLRFLIPVSTFAFAFIVGSRISSCPYRRKPWPTACPSSSRWASERGRCLLWACVGCVGASQRPAETSKVKAMGILTFQSMWARAVLRLASLTVKMERRQLNSGDFCSISLASARARKNSFLPGGCSGPQQNNPRLEECAWKSKQNCRAERWVRLSCTASSWRAVISGKTCLLRRLNCLLRSRPLKLVRKLPATTPSGLSMGTTTNTKWRRRMALAGSAETRKRRSPSTRKEECGSPGCTRPVTSTTFLRRTSSQLELEESEFSSSRLVIVSSGTSSPPRVSARRLCSRQCGAASASSASRPCRREQEQGMEQANSTDWFLCLKLYLNCSWKALRSNPYRQSRSTHATSQQPSCLHSPWPWVSCRSQGLSPCAQRFLRLPKLQMLSWSSPVKSRLRTRKKYQLVCPRVLVSLRRNRSNSLRFTRTAMSRFPHSNEDSNSTSPAHPSTCKRRPFYPTRRIASRTAVRLLLQRERQRQGQSYCWLSWTELEARGPRKTSLKRSSVGRCARRASVQGLGQARGSGQEGSLGRQPKTMSGSREWWWDSRTSRAASLKWQRRAWVASRLPRCSSDSWFSQPSSSRNAFIRINRQEYNRNPPTCKQLQIASATPYTSTLSNLENRESIIQGND